MEELEDIIARSEEQKKPGSYTCRLLAEGTLVERKVNEEAYELLEASFNNDRDEMVYEAADLFFHVLVLLRKKRITLEEVKNELRRRNAKSSL